jgi:hypothetical protein
MLAHVMVGMVLPFIEFMNECTVISGKTVLFVAHI